MPTLSTRAGWARGRGKPRGACQGGACMWPLLRGGGSVWPRRVPGHSRCVSASRVPAPAGPAPEPRSRGAPAGPGEGLAHPPALGAHSSPGCPCLPEWALWTASCRGCRVLLAGGSGPAPRRPVWVGLCHLRTNPRVKLKEAFVPSFPGLLRLRSHVCRVLEGRSPVSWESRPRGWGAAGAGRWDSRGRAASGRRAAAGRQLLWP